MCPFCSQDTNTIDDSIQKFKEIVNGKNAKMRSRVFEGFKTISEDIILDLNTFEAIVMRNASPDSETNKRVIASTYYRFDEIQEILEQIKNLEVGLENYPNIKLKRNVFKKESPFANELEELLIDYHQSLVIIRKIKNQIVDQIKDGINSKKKIVNDFLNIAGIDYYVDFINIDSKIDKKMIIRHKSGKLVDDIKNAFSYGEKTAFSLLMFILQFSKIRETKLLVLDDPISSYDDDKRNAILHLLFDKNPLKLL